MAKRYALRNAQTGRLLATYPEFRPQQETDDPVAASTFRTREEAEWHKFDPDPVGGWSVVQVEVPMQSDMESPNVHPTIPSDD